MMKNTILVLAFFLLSVTNVFTQSRDPESLRGLKGVRLIIQFGRAEAMEAVQRPVILKTLQDDTRAKFLKAGIPLLETAQEIDKAPGSPQFFVTITMDKPNGHVYPVVTKSKLLQKVRLVSDPSIELNISTWETHGVGVYELSNLEMLRGQVGTAVNQFIKSYLTANPK